MSMNAMASESSWHTDTSAAPWIRLQKVQWLDSRVIAWPPRPQETHGRCHARHSQDAASGFSRNGRQSKLISMSLWSAQLGLPVHAWLPLGLAALAPLLLVAVIVPISRRR